MHLSLAVGFPFSPAAGGAGCAPCIGQEGKPGISAFYSPPAPTLRRWATPGALQPYCQGALGTLGTWLRRGLEACPHSVLHCMCQPSPLNAAVVCLTPPEALVCACPTSILPVSVKQRLGVGWQQLLGGGGEGKASWNCGSREQRSKWLRTSPQKQGGGRWKGCV